MLVADDRHAPSDTAAGERPLRASSHDFFVRRSRLRWEELVFWPLVIGSAFAFPTQLSLLTQILVLGLFALSLDLLLGYMGIASLGQAAFFGIGAYAAALIAGYPWSDPLVGLLVAAAVAGLVGAICSLLLARLGGLGRLMATLAIGLSFFELALRAHAITGGEDGLQGLSIHPVLGWLAFDLYGRTAFWYTFAIVLALYLLTRRIVNSPFGLSLEAIRENARRAPAIGISVSRRFIATFSLSAALAGVAGALLTQTTQTVSTSVFGFDRSIGALIMVVFGGAGSLIGALVGAAAYMVAQNWLAHESPLYWNFWVGLMLAVVVVFARGGIIGLTRNLTAKAVRRRR